MSDLLFRNLLVLYLGTFIRFVYLRFIKRKDVLFKELLDLVKEGRTYSQMKWLTEVMVVFFL